LIYCTKRFILKPKHAKQPSCACETSGPKKEYIFIIINRLVRVRILLGQMMRKQWVQIVLLSIALLLFFVIVGHKLLELGKHGDGVEYASVARNMAEGHGSLWKPNFSDTFGKLYREHPPLIYWIQAQLFKLFGDGPYFEGLYGLAVGLIIFACTALFWKRVRKDFGQTPTGAWWPIMLLVSVPVFSYLSQTNRMVFSFAVFAILATYFAYRSMIAEKFAFVYSILAGVLTYLGFISKGPAACFTFAVPLIYWITLPSRLSRTATQTLVLVGVFAVLLLGTFKFYPDSFDFLKFFWNSQIVASLKNQRSARNAYWHLAGRWSAEMIVPLLAAAVLIPATRVSWRRIEFNRQSLFFLLVALSSSLPFMFSRRQNIRYIFQSFPFYALSLAFWTEAVAIRIEEAVAGRKKVLFGLGILALLLLGAGSASMLYHKDHIARRKPFYRDFYLQHIQLPERSIISICPPTIDMDDWLFADMQRFYKASLSAEMGHDYLIIDKDSACVAPPGYTKVQQQPTIRYDLYKMAPPSK
jgi:4-amino-4-deoxy-L-arabinose transferase-like glycosyltransferase